MFSPRISRTIAASFALAASLPVGVQAEDSAQTLSPVVVTATRIEQNSFDLPVAINLVEKDDIQDGQLQLTLSESLIRVPGITAQNRFQIAQDPQISTRGFGARSTFGVRGVRIYVDGIPLSMPDGIAQPGAVDLSSVKGIEVMRGPFSALYGSSSGGVINMLSEDAPKNPTVSAGIIFGSYDTQREIAKVGGTLGQFEYQLDTSHFTSDGYRDHSSGEKNQATAKLKFNISEDTKLTALVNWFDQPWSQDPLGLPRAQAFSDPKSVVVNATNNNTGVKRDHTQVGITLEHTFSENNSFNLMAYGGNRYNLQYITRGVSTGSASEIDRDFWGMDGRWINKGQLFSLPYVLTAGLNYGRMEDARLDTPTANGRVSGASTRNEGNIAWNFDQYLQAQLSATENLDIHAGLRHTDVKVRFDDHLFTDGRDNSGSLEFEKTLPVIGAIFKLTPTFNLYANYGRGFETPTMVEMGFTSLTPENGPNLQLKPGKSKNFEVGAKAWLGSSTLASLSLFKVKTEDEIVIRQQIGGRATYANAGKTQRRGVEFSLDSKLPNNLSLYAAYTLLDATFETPFSYTISGVTTNVLSGNKLPATYRSQLYGEIAWIHPGSGFFGALEGRYNSSSYVNDANSDQTPSYTIFNMRAGFEQKYNGWGFKEFLRVENIGDREYIGSIRPNDGNSRFFEPAPGRNWLLGLNAGYQF